MFYGWYLVGACILISAYFSGVVYLGFTAAFEPLVEEFGWSYTQVSFVSSLRGMETGLLVPLTGLLMDRWGPRRLVMIGTVISGIGFILLSRVNSLALFYAAFLLIAAGLSTTTTTMLMAAVTSWFNKRVGLATGLTASGVSVGGLLLPLITHLIDTHGWREAMVFMGVGMWLIPLPLALLLRHRPEHYGYQPDGKPIAKDGDQTGDLADASKVSTSEPSKGAREALKSPVFWVFSLAFLCQTLPVGAIVTHIMPFFSSVGIDRTAGSVIAGQLPIVTVFGRIGFGWLADRVGKKEVTALALFLTGAGSFLFAFAAKDRMWLIFCFVLVFGIGWGGAVPMLNALFRDQFGTRHIASIMGFAGSVLMAGMMIGAPLAGWIFDTTGNYRPAWFIFAGILMVATVVFLRYNPKR
jgi:MFS family permease